MNLGVLNLTSRILEALLVTVPYWKALRFGINDLRTPSCGSTLNIHQDVLKNENLLHKRGFVDSQFGTSVNTQG